MKANELMIGDWVSYHGIVNRVAPADFCQKAWIDEIRPIPLTAEILEKNGFYYDEDRKAYLMGVIFRVKPERYGLFSFEICGCPYPLDTVHQLQHALKLCGIEKEIIL